MKNRYINLPQIIISLFLLILFITTICLDMNMTMIVNDALIKWAMNGVIVLSLIPMINVGAGRNFGMSIGLSTGLVGMVFAVNVRYTSWKGLLFINNYRNISCYIIWIFIFKSIKQTKGNEEIIGTFAGYSFIPIMNLFYTFVPVTNRQMLYL